MIDQRTAPWAALLLRVTLGSLFIAHLYWKFAILPGGLNTWWSNFAANGYPSITPMVLHIGEFLGAILLIPGIWTRWIALYTLPLVVGAAHFWAIRKGFFFVGAGSELPVVWSVMLAVQFLLGDGADASSSIVCRSNAIEGCVGDHHRSPGPMLTAGRLPISSLSGARQDGCAFRIVPDL